MDESNLLWSGEKSERREGMNCRSVPRYDKGPKPDARYRPVAREGRFRATSQSALPNGLGCMGKWDRLKASSSEG